MRLDLKGGSRLTKSAQAEFMPRRMGMVSPIRMVDGGKPGDGMAHGQLPQGLPSLKSAWPLATCLQRWPGFPFKAPLSALLRTSPSFASILGSSNLLLVLASRRSTRLCSDLISARTTAKSAPMAPEGRPGFGCARVTWNNALALSQQFHRQGGKSPRWRRATEGVHQPSQAHACKGVAWRQGLRCQPRIPSSALRKRWVWPGA